MDMPLTMPLETIKEEAYVTAARNSVDEIRRYVEQQRQSLVECNVVLPGQLCLLKEGRRGRRDAAQDLLDRF